MQILDSNYSSTIQSNDMALFDRVEVIGGATDLTNGIGTPGATLNMVRKRPPYTPQTRLSISGGSWNYQRTELDTSGPLTESGNVRARLIGVYHDSESYIDRLNERKKVFYGSSAIAIAAPFWRQPCKRKAMGCISNQSPFNNVIQ